MLPWVDRPALRRRAGAAEAGVEQERAPRVADQPPAYTDPPLRVGGADGDRVVIVRQERVHGWMSGNVSAIGPAPKSASSTDVISTGPILRVACVIAARP